MVTQMKDLEAAIEHLNQVALEESTHSAYKGTYRVWEFFCKSFGLRAQKPTERTLQVYVGYRLLHSTIVYRSLKRELSAIRSYALMHGQTYRPYPEMQQLQRTLTGFKKERNTSFKKQPLSHSQMRRFLTHFSGSDHNSLLWSALLQFGFCSLARVGEYTVKTQADRFHPRTLRMSNLQYYPSKARATTVTIKLNGSKTNQFGEEEFLSLKCACHTGICGFCALRKYIVQRGRLAKDAYLFQFRDGKLVSDDHVRKLIGKLCVRERMDPEQYSTHSLRSGGATALAEIGVPTELIQRLGRWSPSSFTLQKRYLKVSAQTTAHLIDKARSSAQRGTGKRGSRKRTKGST
jgi:site-specific recombinase XerD